MDCQALRFPDLPLGEALSDLCAGKCIIRCDGRQQKDGGRREGGQPPRLVPLPAVHQLVVGTAQQGGCQPGQLLPQGAAPAPPEITGQGMPRHPLDPCKHRGQDFLRLAVRKNRKDLPDVMGLQKIADLPLDPFRPGRRPRTEDDQVFAVVQLPAQLLRQVRPRTQIRRVAEDAPHAPGRARGRIPAVTGSEAVFR